MKKKKTKKISNSKKNNINSNINKAYLLKLQGSKKFEIQGHPTLSLVIRISIIIFLILAAIATIASFFLR